MTTYSNILAWKIPQTEEPGGLQSIGLQSQTQLKQLCVHAGPQTSFFLAQAFPCCYSLSFLDSFLEWRGQFTLPCFHLFVTYSLLVICFLFMTISSKILHQKVMQISLRFHEERGRGFICHTKQQNCNEIFHQTFLGRLHSTIYVNGTLWRCVVHGFPALPLVGSSPKIPFLLTMVSCSLPFVVMSKIIFIIQFHLLWTLPSSSTNKNSLVCSGRPCCGFHMFLRVFNPSILLKGVTLSLKEGVELLLVVVHNN